VDPVRGRVSADLDRQVQQPLGLQAAGGATHGEPAHGRHTGDKHVYPGGREMHGGQIKIKLKLKKNMYGYV